ncbi:unnamed protein product [Didymodactylos carnosus]|uniref:Uncharacterized protein n=2 Tax=Didymodactylos carnosus TaxID=1234261 RepID=A0A814PNI1_9BILA|nr:unnamed protein product [Didymodactylos carnosus]CAF3873122.1 unnamed protein product [Didymodactylos carnosus]
MPLSQWKRQKQLSPRLKDCLSAHDDPNEIDIRNLYKKTAALAFMPPTAVKDLWSQTTDEYDTINGISPFFDYVTETWIEDSLFDISL